MQVNILSWDKEKATAKIQFVHNGITHEQSYSLIMVIPGTDLILKQLNQSFTEQMQQTVIDKLTEQIKRDIDAGIIVNKI